MMHREKYVFPIGPQTHPQSNISPALISQNQRLNVIKTWKYLWAVLMLLRVVYPMKASLLLR